MKHIKTCAFLIILCGLLSGCPAQFTHDAQIVKVPIAVKCIEQLPEKPKLHTDAEIKAMGDYEAAIMLLDDRIKREIYESKLEAVLEGCR